MNTMKPASTLFQRIFLPGFLFQSVMIGGGYATGRELVEFFLSAGPVGGLLGLLVATLGFSAIAALSFEFARITKSYNYRHFFKQLLGKYWFLFEIAYFILGLLVLAVIGAAAGELVATHLGISSALGTITLMLLVGVLVFWGTVLIEKVLAGWSFLLYATYGVFVVFYLWHYGGDLSVNLSEGTIGDRWLIDSVKYVGYSAAVIPVIFFCVKHLHSRRDAVTAGLLAGPIAMLPALLFFLAMAATYPAVLDASVPADFMMQRLDISWLKAIFYIVVFGTFVETGTAFIHAVNERIYEVYSEKNKTMPRWLRPVIAIIALLISIFLARKFGLIDLISQGYGTLTWVFVLVFIVPLFTLGLAKVIRHTASQKPKTSIDKQN
ncbi:hypothetical protein OAE19_08080 [Porticoccaceae bacterium]|nr:hypothetical protein [Porticoccaceae bacterium]